MREKLSKRTVEAAQPAERDVFVWDTELLGFGVKITPKGGRIYVLQYRLKGRVCRCTIGRHGVDVTVDQARREAQRLRGLVATGKNPAEERSRERMAPTVKELAARYMAEHAIPHKKPSSAATDRRNLDNHVIPQLGRRLVSEVTAVDIARMVRAIAKGETAKDEKTEAKRGRRIVEGGPGIANRCLALVSKMFSLAEIWEVVPRGSNPCVHAEKFAARKMERFLSTEELGRLGLALAAAERGELVIEARPPDAAGKAKAGAPGSPRKRKEHPVAIACGATI